ncbi:hypothetical protein E2562_004509 [Oryza meyeriana var. granulata]|uniref:AP2/ERF domain-containing protein n=1 Tax=Oryza meyeriana var. granulata TaxID=110450 RepID=A0A6G1F3B4_9ORYZ|nr:hypothetical protein E2562_004509 [Oryza meyeriana var. granulata]
MEGEAFVVPARKKRKKGWAATEYRGVRSRWGRRYVAEIHNPMATDRVWLGTFNSAEEAAWAYDTAARVLRGGVAKTNFTDLPPTPPQTAEMRGAEATRWVPPTPTRTGGVAIGYGERSPSFVAARATANI